MLVSNWKDLTQNFNLAHRDHGYITSLHNIICILLYNNYIPIYFIYKSEMTCQLLTLSLSLSIGASSSNLIHA